MELTQGVSIDTFSREELEAARNRLATVGISIGAGVKDQEIEVVEAMFHFQFPSDLRWFISTGMPTGRRFPNWREPDDTLLEQIQWPVQGICFDITHGTFWWPNWGPRPDSAEGAVAVAMEHLCKLPPLIPVFGHCYLPSDPPNADNPVFSVHQSDVIHRGRNLAHYLRWIRHDESNDSIELQYPVFGEDYRPIPFWTDMVCANTRPSKPTAVQQGTARQQK